MTTKTADKALLEVKRFIKAPRERVYQAWTDPAKLKEWWGPEGVRTRSLSVAPHVGCKYRWDLVNQKGEEMSVFGEYRELVPEKRIVFTWQWDDDEVWQNRTSIVTIELSDRDGGTEVRLRHEQLPSEESRDRHNQGWNSVLDRLEQFVGK
jgi:glutathione S-transferase